MDKKYQYSTRLAMASEIKLKAAKARIAELESAQPKAEKVEKLVSDLKVSTGYSSIEEEFEDSLRKAFVLHRAKKIIIDSRLKRFQLESANYGILNGWIEGELVEYDEQSSAYEFQLTDAGRKHFGECER